MQIPLLYPILDADSLIAASTRGSATQSVCAHARALAEAGCTLMQYRFKRLAIREALAQARELRRILPGVTLIMNDRADLCLAAGFDGLHVGQDDLSPEAARSIVGPKAIVGLSTHSSEQMREALTKPVDYLAIGPVFATGSKANPDPLVGLGGVSEAQRLRDASCPHSANEGRVGAPPGRALSLVAIGGITRANAAAVLKAGADTVAVIGDLSSSPLESAREFLRLMM